jgi:hypothetical protein
MLLPSAWYSTLPPLGAESPSVTRSSGRSPEVALTTPSLVPQVRSLSDDPMLLEAGLRAAPRGVSTRPVSLTTVFDRIRSPLLLPPPVARLL